ncbi:NAD(P)/FAD-dependent oxidoreductase [Salsipaludibacter albus]|uniref:NAD(P)/FAD-dependent oxidoreductase n=1 Tax=Salsipaludibacter albus TaxID=2849650 RepID=UPI001EE4D017|nr:FAD-dependent oxidoreductase [Salsipaludibacter albus]MBY5161012.1 FAD-dependent monooxygenase [Salsipaludibacter albus]
MHPDPPTPQADVVVVGARPAGAATARALARRGHRVVVLDRSRRGSDTLSTHALMRPAVMLLERWGLVDALVERGTPAIERVTFRYGSSNPVVVSLDSPLYAPRRTVLDPVVSDAAVAAGAEVHHGVRVDGLLRDERGRVAGVAWHGRDGSSGTVRAPWVVGADGRTSLVVRAVRPPVTRHGRHASATVYTHVTGLATDGLEWWYGAGGVSAGVVPTNDGQACVFVMGPAARFARDRGPGLDRWFTRLLSEVGPELAVRVADAGSGAPLRGFPGTPGWLRRPHGRGWALVGDAGAFRDPATAHGLTDALRDARLLGMALDGALREPATARTALAAYEHQRDHLAGPVFAVTDAIASSTWDLDEVAVLHRELSVAMQAEAAALATPALQGA